MALHDMPIDHVA